MSTERAFDPTIPATASPEVEFISLSHLNPSTELNPVPSRGIDLTYFRRYVAALEDGGYVLRHPDPDDGRAVQVAATPSGKGLVSGVGEARVAALSSRLAALPEADRAALLAALPALEALAADGG